ncbi:MAG TPA: T9SS type A sorting domain-containing protein [Flavobacterium sp.]|uniref:T9SS type A sorting domain-containing protein n=1 Tax=Flavobacterium sp. TaxID=239 RepID=UPI002C81F1C6|nr:T9SS type A sorting domain-containing protein [Flavobacterium sp.]HSD13179.1 T9SS type A sorting domain-containing protein [Flavobacterium sp.]
MKLKLPIFLIPFLLLSAIGFSQNPQKNILFVGNSITYFNDMPILFRDIANNKGKNVATQMHTVGGAGFVNHVTDSNLYNLFRNTVWDAVVLQPGSGESAGASWPVNTTIERGQKLIDSIKKYSPCAKVFLYEIPYGVPSETTYDTYQSVQTQIKDSITKMADNLHLPLVPAGESARMHYTVQQDLLLHGSYNDIHPNLNGSYLIASTMFAAIFQEPVTGTTSYGGVIQATAEYFHSIADQVVLPNKPQWRINTYNLHSGFNYVVNGNSISFTNTSNNYTSLLWDFGDGITSIQQNPTHIYTSGGIKIIKLKAIRNGCEEIIEKQIDLGTLSTIGFEQNDARLYPNPAHSVLNFETLSPTSIKIISTLGQEIFRSDEQKNNWQINVSTLQSGIYFVVTESQSVYKFIKS